MRILITNDDGINGEGLLALADSLKNEHEVYVCAPMEQRSSSSHSVHYVRRALKVSEVSISGVKKAWAVDGMPADCTYVGLFLLEKQVDLVISGINQGQNLSLDCFYSGTVGAAREALILGIPAMAVSLASNRNHDFRAACIATRHLINVYLKDPECRNYLLNVNVPVGNPSDIKGYRSTTSDPLYGYQLKMIKEGNGKNFTVRLTDGDLIGGEQGDLGWIRSGYITCMPIGLQVCDEGTLIRISHKLDREGI